MNRLSRPNPGIAVTRSGAALIGATAAGYGVLAFSCVAPKLLSPHVAIAVALVCTVLSLVSGAYMRKAIRGRVEASWERILECPEISITEVDLKSGRIKLGASWEAIFGRTENAPLVNRTQLRDRIMPEDLRLFDQDLRAHLDGQSDFVRRELRVRCADGGFKWASVRVKGVDRDRQGVPTRLVGMVIDIDKRRRAEQLLADMNRCLMSTLSSVTSQIVVLTADGSIVLANESWLRYRGAPLTLGERTSIGDNYFARLRRVEGSHAPLAAEILATAEALLRGENPDTDINYQTIGESGACFLVRLTRFDLPDGPRITVTHRDVTGTVAAERAARENEQRWRFAIDGWGVSIWDWDADQKKIFRSARFFKMLGMDAEEFAEDCDPRLASLAHADDRPLVAEKFAGLMRGDHDACAFEHRLRHKDGSWRWVMARCTVMRRAPDRQATRILGVQTDITELKNAESQLRARELENRLLAQVAQHTTNAVIITDAAGRIEWVNRGCEAMTGYGLAEARNRAPQELLLGADTDAQTTLLLNENWAAGEHLRTKLLLYRKGGTPFWAAIEFQPIVDENQTRRHCVVVMEDVTERERLEAERRLSQKLESVGQLAAGVAHEINTPIQFVGDSITFLEEAWQEIGPFVAVAHDIGMNADGPGSELARRCPNNLRYLLNHFPEALGRAQDGVKRVAVIVRAMKEFAYPDRGQLAVADINHAVHTTLTVARNEYKYVGTVTTECGELPPVRCSPSAVSQVLLNLIVNAAHALEDLHHDPATGRITVKTSVAGEHVVVSVSDNGCGIPDHIVERIFDPFFTSKEVGRGTGQGLAIARAIVVDQHQGRITVKSKVGQGTTFEVWLPIDGPAAAQDSAEVPRLRTA